MKLGELTRALDRTQQARWFKVAASALMFLILAGGFTWYAVGVSSGQLGGANQVLERLESQGDPDADARAELVRLVLNESSGIPAVGLAAAGLLGVSLITIWLGLGLTYLFYSVVGGALVGLLMLFDATEVYGRFLAGVITLAFSFSVLLQGLRVLFGGPGPVFGVARNLLTEAVRMKVSVVLIVLLMLILAVLPGYIDSEQPLRYRVQQFLTYAVSGSFWIMAVLTLAFGVSSITAEQRNKVIWQTVTKPVAKWEYLLGKWLGLVGLNAVLLLVCAAGTFLFVEYLRNQPAIGETRAYIAEEVSVTEDRFLLESRVLTARRAQPLEIPEELSLDSPEFQNRVQDYIARERIVDPSFATTPEMLEEVVSDLHESALRAFRSIPNAGRRVYRVAGLDEARERGQPVTLHMRIEAMGNRPDIFFTMSFLLPSLDMPPIERTMGLGYFHNITLPAEAIDEDGVLEIMVFNGAIRTSNLGGLEIVANPSGALMPEDGFEIYYQAGSYHWNFMRVMVVLWVKLAFLAMVAVFASTFLSFPVACLVAFGVFLLAEMSGFLNTAVESYALTDRQGEVVWYKVFFSGVTEIISSLFRFYGDLKPVRRLVDGRLLPWGSVAGGTGFMGLLSLILFFASVLIFRRRELATYSGQ